MKTIIAGLIYTNGDELLRPHYSGEFSIVDCTEYKTKEQIKDEYSGKALKTMLSGLCLTYEGVKYYECEYSPFSTDGMELLSDIWVVKHYDEETEF